MSDRWEKRKHTKETENIVKKAKKDMASWITELSHIPSEAELKAWQSGYLYGINRGTGNRNDN